MSFGNKNRHSIKNIAHVSNDKFKHTIRVTDYCLNVLLRLKQVNTAISLGTGYIIMYGHVCADWCKLGLWIFGVHKCANIFIISVCTGLDGQVVLMQ